MIGIQPESKGGFLTPALSRGTPCAVIDADRRGVSRCLDRRADNGQNNKELPALLQRYTYKRQCKGHAVDSVLYSASVIERGQ